MHYLNRQQALRKRERLIRIYSARDPEFDRDGRYAKLLIKTRKPCSCPACQRSRKYEDETVQERRQWFDRLVRDAERKGVETCYKSS